MSQLRPYREHALSGIKCWLLDMDGTITLGEELLPGAKEFFASIRQADYIFLTNNSAHAATHYMQRLQRLGIPTRRSQVLTSTDALALYLRRSSLSGQSLRLFPVGTPAFEAELQDAGMVLVREREQDIDYVVLGFDTTLTYEKLDIACDYIRAGYPYLAANPDKVCPLPGNKVLPDCGAIIAFLEACTGKKPQKIIGKPDLAMVDMVKASRGYQVHELAMVGDRIYTDLAVARSAGITCIAVLSGEATREEIMASGIEPDYIFPSVAELAEQVNAENSERV